MFLFFLVNSEPTDVALRTHASWLKFFASVAEYRVTDTHTRVYAKPGNDANCFQTVISPFCLTPIAMTISLIVGTLDCYRLLFYLLLRSSILPIKNARELTTDSVLLTSFGFTGDEQLFFHGGERERAAGYCAQHFGAGLLGHARWCR